jgi:hypothetical protein
MRILLTIFSILIFQLGFAQSQSDTDRIYPSNDMYKDSSLVTFINTLKNVAIHKDTATLFKMLDKHVFSPGSGDVSDFAWAYSGFGENDDMLAFKRIWGFDTSSYSINHLSYRDYKESDLWPLLLRLIEIGGTFDHDISGQELFTMPYTNAYKYLDTFPRGYTEAMLAGWRKRYTVVCLNKNVPVFERPDTTSLIVGRLTYDVVNPVYSMMGFSDTTDVQYNYFYPMVFNWDILPVATKNYKIKGWVQGKYLFYMSFWYTLRLEKKNNEWKITFINQF